MGWTLPGSDAWHRACGVSSDDDERALFEPFFPLKPHGTGLGLAFRVTLLLVQRG